MSDRSSGDDELHGVGVLPVGVPRVLRVVIVRDRDQGRTVVHVELPHVLPGDGARETARTAAETDTEVAVPARRDRSRARAGRAEELHIGVDDGVAGQEVHRGAVEAPRLRERREEPVGLGRARSPKFGVARLDPGRSTDQILRGVRRRGDPDHGQVGHRGRTRAASRTRRAAGPRGARSAGGARRTARGGRARAPGGAGHAGGTRRTAGASCATCSGCAVVGTPGLDVGAGLGILQEVTVGLVAVPAVGAVVQHRLGAVGLVGDAHLVLRPAGIAGLALDRAALRGAHRSASAGTAAASRATGSRGTRSAGSAGRTRRTARACRTGRTRSASRPGGTRGTRGTSRASRAAGPRRTRGAGSAGGAGRTGGARGPSRAGCTRSASRTRGTARARRTGRTTRACVAAVRERVRGPDPAVATDVVAVGALAPLRTGGTDGDAGAGIRTPAASRTCGASRARRTAGPRGTGGRAGGTSRASTGSTGATRGTGSTGRPTRARRVGNQGVGRIVAHEVSPGLGVHAVRELRCILHVAVGRDAEGVDLVVAARRLERRRETVDRLGEIADQDRRALPHAAEAVAGDRVAIDVLGRDVARVVERALVQLVRSGADLLVGQLAILVGRACTEHEGAENEGERTENEETGTGHARLLVFGGENYVKV